MKGVQAAVAPIGVAVMLSISACAEFETQTVRVAAAPQPALEGPRAGPGRTTTASGPNQVRAEIIRWFSNNGYKPIQAEALAEHAKIESGYRPCAANGAGLRYTFQWGGARLQKLLRFARSDGCPPLEKQLAFADYELRNEPAYSCFWGAQTRNTAIAALRRGFGRGSC